MGAAFTLRKRDVPPLNEHRGALPHSHKDGQVNHPLKSRERKRNNRPRKRGRRARKQISDEPTAPPCIHEYDAALERSARLLLDLQDRSARSSQTASTQLQPKSIQNEPLRTEHQFNAPEVKAEHQINAPQVMTDYGFKKEVKEHPFPESHTSTRKVNESECDSRTTFASAQDTTGSTELATSPSTHTATAEQPASSESHSTNKEATDQAAPSEPTEARQKPNVLSELNRAQLTIEAAAEPNGPLEPRQLNGPLESRDAQSANHATEPTLRGVEALQTGNPPTTSTNIRPTDNAKELTFRGAEAQPTTHEVTTAGISRLPDPTGPLACKTYAPTTATTMQPAPTESPQIQPTATAVTMQLASAEPSKTQSTAPSELIKAQQTTSATDTQPVQPESSLSNPAAPATTTITCVPSDVLKEVNLNPSESKHSTLPSKASIRRYDLTGHCINHIPKQYSANSNTKCLRTVELNPRCLQEAIEELTYSALETNTIVDSKIKAASFQQLDSLEANAITRSNRTVSPLALLTAILTFNKTCQLGLDFYQRDPSRSGKKIDHIYEFDHLRKFEIMT